MAAHKNKKLGDEDDDVPSFEEEGDADAADRADEMDSGNDETENVASSGSVAADDFHSKKHLNKHHKTGKKVETEHKPAFAKKNVEDEEESPMSLKKEMMDEDMQPPQPAHKGKNTKGHHKNSKKKAHRKSSKSKSAHKKTKPVSKVTEEDPFETFEQSLTNHHPE